MRALITGVNGFVGEYLASYLQAQNIEVYGTIIIGACSNPKVHVEYMDLLDSDQTLAVINKIRPDFIYHLAGQSNVAVSWKEPGMTINVNAMGTVNLLEAVRKAVPKARTLIIGTADQYGTVLSDACPLKESEEVNPQSPYALSKAIQEKTAQFYGKTYGLDIILVRAFNHIGPMQNLGFVVPDFASKIVRIELGLEETMLVGNLSAARDFSDVRDIVRGYFLLMQKGRAGEIYNICSGKAIKIADILEILCSYAKCKIEVAEDPSKMRPSDAPVIYGDYTKIHEHTGYQPEIDIKETLKEILEYWRLRIADEIK